MFFINPFIYAGGGDFESIATVTVGSGGASSIEFTSIPTSTYQHLQLRSIFSTNRATYGQDDVNMQVGNGSVDTGSNYAWHHLTGDGAAASATAGTSATNILIGATSGASGGVSMFGAMVLDILDYASTSKYKTVRALRGIDTNGAVAGFAGFVGLSSGVWMSTSSVTAIKLLPRFGSNFAQHTTTALYGVRA